MKRWSPTHRTVAVGLMLMTLSAGLVGGLLRLRLDTGIDSFLPAGDSTLVAVERKARDFGGDPVIVLLRYRVPRQFVTEPSQLLALLRTEGTLSRLPDVAAVYGPATVLNQLASAAQDFLAQIAGRRDGLRAVTEQAAQRAGKSPAQVTRAGDSAVTELDLRYAPLLVRGLPVGMPTLSNPRFAAAMLFGSEGVARPEWHFLVPAPDTVAILVRPRDNLDQAGTGRLVDAIRSTVADAGLSTTSVTVSGVPVVTAAIAAEVRREGPLLGLLVAVVVLARFLLVPMPGAVDGQRLRPTSLLLRLRPLAASLLGGAVTLALFGWLGHPLSLTSVLLLPLLLGVGSSFPLYLASVRNRRRIMTMSAASAAACLALAVSPLPFIRDLGYALAVGILMTVVAAAGLGVRAPEFLNDVPVQPPGPGPGRRIWMMTVAAASALALWGWVLLPGLAVQADPAELGRGLPALTDAQAADTALGASGEISIELTGPNVVSPAALNWTRAAQTALAASHGDQLRLVASPASLLGFLGPSPTREQISSALGLLPHYLTAPVIRPDYQASLLVYGVRLQDMAAQSELLAGARAALPPPPPGFQVGMVGLPVAAVRGYQLLLDDRYLANLAGIVAAGVILALGLRRRADAGHAAAAAVLATGWGLLALYAFDLALSPLTVGLGSLVTVTGCEFVVLLAEARRSGIEWLPRSVRYACLTSILGYLLLMESQLRLVREFGVVLAAATALSYLAARLTVTHCSGPLGKMPNPL